MITLVYFFFFNDTATTDFYTLSLHDALPICKCGWSDGSFSVLMIKNVLGIEFDAQKDLLKIRPLTVTPSFNWNDFPLTDNLKVNLSYQSESGQQKLIANLHGAEQRKVTLEFKPQGWSTGISKDLASDTKVRFEKERN